MPARWPAFLGDMRSHQASILEWSLLNGQPVMYRRIDKESTELLDDLHGEVLSGAVSYLPDVELFTQLELNPDQQLLTIYGLDQQRDVIIRPALIACAHATLAVYPDGDVTSEPQYFLRIGDRFVWDDDIFEVKEVFKDKRWANSTRPLYLFMTAKRINPDTNDVDCP